MSWEVLGGNSRSSGDHVLRLVKSCPVKEASEFLTHRTRPALRPSRHRSPLQETRIYGTEAGYFDVRDTAEQAFCPFLFTYALSLISLPSIQHTVTTSDKLPGQGPNCRTLLVQWQMLLLNIEILSPTINN